MSSNALAERVMVAREQASAEREEIQVSQALAPDARPLHVVHPPRTRVAEHDTVPVGALAKRIFDLALASTALIALSPLLASVALWIRLDSPGPALFRQRRGGYRGETFLVLKFRTMTAMDDGKTILQAQPSDPRVTALGAFLRRTSIDELPQLINVLKGEMSIVGPRPHAVAHDVQFSRVDPTYPRRFKARPGMTGLAQVCGHRGVTKDDTSVRSRLGEDLRYIETWSMQLDLKIIARTVALVLRDAKVI